MTDLAKWKTWAEIQRQGQIWRKFVPELGGQLAALRQWIEDSDIDEVWFSGAGTSAYIGDFVAAGLSTSSTRILRSVASTDLVSAPKQFIGRTRPLVVSFGRSGNSAESVGVLNVLDKLCPDAPRLNITCNAESVLATRSAQNQRVLILPDETHDAGFAMTSSYSTMLLSALALFDPTPPDAPAQRLAVALDAALPRYLTMAESMAMPARIVITGSGALRYAARESALKIMELTAGRIPVLWDTSLGFRHGPKSFVTRGTHVICLTSADPDIARYDRDLASEIRHQFKKVTVTELPPTDLIDTWGAVVQVASAQVIAVVLSDRLGLNVDDPFEGLGTLTRVVSEVTLYPPATPA